MARKGDLVLVETVERSYRIGAPSTETTSYSFGLVHSATRDGVVKKWSGVGYGDELVSDVGVKLRPGQRIWVLPKTEIDVAAVLQAAKTHHWPGHPGQPMPFESLDEARDVARPHQLRKAS